MPPTTPGLTHHLHSLTTYMALGALLSAPRGPEEPLHTRGEPAARGPRTLGSSRMLHVSSPSASDGRSKDVGRLGDLTFDDRAADAAQPAMKSWARTVLRPFAVARLVAWLMSQ